MRLSALAVQQLLAQRKSFSTPRSSLVLMQRYGLRVVGNSSSETPGHARALSSISLVYHPPAESPPFQLRGGDILQFGVARQGGVEDRYKCVTVKVWIGKEPQATLDVSKSVPLSQLSCPRADIA
jgi:hypothetical protein